MPKLYFKVEITRTIVEHAFVEMGAEIDMEEIETGNYTCDRRDGFINVLSKNGSDSLAVIHNGDTVAVSDTLKITMAD